MDTQHKKSQAHSSYDNLRWQLMHGQLTPGSRLVEEKWAAHLGINRSALREALTMLAHEGFLETRPKGGFFVPTHSQITLDEVLEVRLALEVGALQVLEVRGSIPEAGLIQLHQSCDLMRQLMEAGFEYGFTEADRKFHEILVAMAENPRLLRIYRQAPLPLAPLPEPEEGARRENMRKTLAEHIELCQLLEQGRIRDAVDLLRRHLLTDHQGGAS